MCYRHAAHHKWAHHPKFKHWKRKARHGKWSKWPGFTGAWGYPPANVLEYDDRFELLLYAPGLEKSDFTIKVVDRVLSISVDRKETTEANDFSWKRKEFNTDGFTRRFELNDKIDTKEISAKYEAGILQLSFPKLEDHFTERQDIEIA